MRPTGSSYNLQLLVFSVLLRRFNVDRIVGGFQRFSHSQRCCLKSSAHTHANNPEFTVVDH